MSAREKKDQAINPQPEYEEPSAGKRPPEQDQSRIGGQARSAQTPESGPREDDAERTGEGTGARAGEYG